MRHGNDLQISQDLKFQSRSWTVQRRGWILLALFLLAAMSGLFGSGPLSRTTAGQQDSQLWAEYYRFWHSQSPMTLRLHLGRQFVRDGEVRIWLSRSYMEKMAVQHVTPQPRRVEAGSDRFTYVFTLSQPALPTAVTFSLKPQTAGFVPGQAGLENGWTIRFGHFIYP